MLKRSFVPDESSGVRKKTRADPRLPIYDEKTGKRVAGVRLTRTGNRYECKIHHPITYKDLWVGTFDTVEEASEAYQARKKQLLERNKDGVICGEFDSKSKVYGEYSGERVAGVWKTTKGGRYDTKIHDPFTKKDVWIGTFDTVLEASKAFDAKKKEFEAAEGVVRRTRNNDRTEVVFDEETGERVVGVWKWKTAKKYVTKIRNPCTYVCVGTFDTVQQASEAYYRAKKKESEKVKVFDEIQESFSDHFRVSSSSESTCDQVEVLSQKGKQTSDS